MYFQDRFADRAEAGRRLGAELAARGYGERSDLLVLALPRGGVPVAFEVARALHAPLDVFMVRKLGVPGQEELAMGAIASGGIRVINREVVDMLAIPDAVIDQVAKIQQAELERREQQYRASRASRASGALPDIRGRTVIVIDDGLATGSTMRAAVAALRQQGPARIIVAIPVAAREACELLREEADEVACLMMPELFHAVGQWYEQFPQTSEQEVRELLGQAAVRPTGVSAGPDQMGATRE
jgi:predicted phosphoribosyltransferase